jgi:competence protein ComEA
VEPSSSPPWRVLEAPTDPGAAGASAAGRPAKTPASTYLIKVALGVIGAIACAGVAIAVAISGGGGDVRVDGGSALPGVVASGYPATSGAPLRAANGSDGQLVVEIVGAVQAPGVYRLPAGSRLADLLERAGGYGPRVDAARAEQDLNLAAPVKDGEHVRVPSRDDPETPRATDGAAPAASASAAVDINTATQAQLEELPGIGPATAQKIIAARDEAPFTTIDELRSRGVLGEKTFDKLRALLTVG